MLGYWSVIILLGILMCYNLINAYKDYTSDNKTLKFAGHLILLLVLFIIILNSLFTVMEFGLETTTIFSK